MLHTVLNRSLICLFTERNKPGLLSYLCRTFFRFIGSALVKIKVLSHVKFATDKKDIELPNLLATAVAMPVMYCL